MMFPWNVESHSRNRTYFYYWRASQFTVSTVNWISIISNALTMSLAHIYHDLALKWIYSILIGPSYVFAIDFNWNNVNNQHIELWICMNYYYFFFSRNSICLQLGNLAFTAKWIRHELKWFEKLVTSYGFISNQLKLNRNLFKLLQILNKTEWNKILTF